MISKSCQKPKAGKLSVHCLSPKLPGLSLAATENDLTKDLMGDGS